jgi:hypothetical protein
MTGMVNSNTLCLYSNLTSTTESNLSSTRDGENETAQDDKLPGWLRGPTSRQRSALKEEWESAVDPKTGQLCWRNIKTGEYRL